jgi:signal transduction histidine kinase
MGERADAVSLPRALPRRALKAQFDGRAQRDLVFCAAEVALGLCGIVVLAAAVTLPLFLSVAIAGFLPSGHTHMHPSRSVTRAALLVSLVAGMVLVPRAGRGLGALHRQLTARLTGERIATPPVRRSGGLLARLTADVRDGPGWKAAAYQVLKLPVTVAEAYAALLAVAGLADLAYPVWWLAFQPSAGGARPAVLAVTPVGLLRVASFAGTFAVLAIGAGMLLAAPWAARAIGSADRWLMRELLSAGQLALRVADLEETRAIAVEDSAALLRRLERNLHDGAQIRLATLAMNLGLARQKLGDDADPAIRELIDAAHRGAKEAITELRSLARGIHPPVLDSGLADALESLADASAIPTQVTTDIKNRPSPAIETIAYFCATELLTNAVKYSGAGTIEISAVERREMLRLRVTDDGRGGASPSAGSGLAGLAQRVRTVDGRIDILSPAGGPTRITVTLPIRALPDLRMREQIED